MLRAQRHPLFTTIALIAGCTLTTPLDRHGPGSTAGVGGSSGAGSGAGDIGGGSGTTLTLAATAANHHRIDLVWTGGLPAVDIERDGTIIRTGIDGTSFQDRGLEPSRRYAYRVRAGTEWSLSASATTQAAPQGAYYEHVVADEPRAYWRMEENAPNILSDTMGNVSTGLLEGVATQVGGKIGAGVHFDGDSGRGDLRTVHGADSDWGWSWELWISVGAIPANESGLLGCANSPRWTINPLGEITGGMGRRSDVGFIPWTSELVIDVARWYHMVLTVAGSISDAPVLKLYVDGQLAIQESFSEPVHSPWSHGNAGRNANGDLRLDVRDGYHEIKGTYDEAAAYDYVLSAAQVQRHFAVGSRL